MKNDKLNGGADIYTRAYTESGRFENDVKQGIFYRDYNDDGRCASTYVDGVNVSDKKYSYGHKNIKSEFGCIMLSDNDYYLGDVYDNLPNGYGVICCTDQNRRITSKMFRKIYGRKVVNALI